MNVRKIASVALLLTGEALIIFCFLHFGKNADPQVRTLNIIVASVIYSLNFIDLLIPWVNFRDRAQKTIGSIGLRWMVTFLYILFALGAMIVFNLFFVLSFENQLLVHAILLFLFLVGIFLAFTSSSNVQSVFEQEERNRSGIAEMKKLTHEVLIKLDQIDGFPAGLKNKINDLHENLRYLSPGNNPEAPALEKEYLNAMKAIYDRLFDRPPDEEKIERLIGECERLCKDRKQIYSN